MTIPQPTLRLAFTLGPVALALAGVALAATASAAAPTGWMWTVEDSLVYEGCVGGCPTFPWIGRADPLVEWGYSDADGHSQNAVQIQGSYYKDFPSTFYDSGTISTSSTSRRVSVSVTEGAEAYFRVRVRDSTNTWSAWSSPVNGCYCSFAIKFDLTGPVKYGSGGGETGWMNSIWSHNIYYGDSLSGLQHQWFRIGTSSGGSNVVGATVYDGQQSFTPPTLAQGYNYVTTWATDNAHPGRTTTHTDVAVVKYDTIPPVTTASPPAPGRNGWYTSASVSVPLSASDGTGQVSGVATVRYRIDGGAWTAVSGSSATASVTGEGAHTVTYQAQDAALNWEAEKSLSLRIDSVRPTSTSGRSPSSPDGENGWYRSCVTVTVTGSDATSGVWKNRHKTDAGSWSESTTNPTTVPAVCSDSSDHRVHYRAFDEAGNEELTDATANQNTFKIDATAPTTTTARSPASPNGDNGWYTTAVDFTVACSDATSLCASRHYSLDGGGWTTYTGAVTVGGDGHHSACAYSKDNAGNTDSGAACQWFSIDRTRPTTSFTQSPADGENGWYRYRADFTARCSDDLSGCASVSFKVDNGPWEQNGPDPVSFRVTGDGNHTVTMKSRDLAGNEHVLAAVTVRIDATRPVAWITVSDHTDPLDQDQYVLKADLTVHCSDTFSGCAARWYSIDGGAWQEGGSFSMYAPYYVGTHTVCAYAKDTAGNVGSPLCRVVRIVPASLPNPGSPLNDAQILYETRWGYRLFATPVFGIDCLGFHSSDVWLRGNRLLTDPVGVVDARAGVVIDC